jgi:very-short-patch-repair endonuclease
MQTHLKDFQRDLRKNMPVPEVILWQAIRNGQLGVKFRRQFTIGNFIIDFYAPRMRLGVELDGESHFYSQDVQNRDKMRDEFLSKQGIKILRFLNPDVMGNLEGVLTTIVEEIKKRF